VESAHAVVDAVGADSAGGRRAYRDAYVKIIEINVPHPRFPRSEIPIPNHYAAINPTE
jgi:hypothetical protein